MAPLRNWRGGVGVVPSRTRVGGVGLAPPGTGWRDGPLFELKRIRGLGHFLELKEIHEFDPPKAEGVSAGFTLT